MKFTLIERQLCAAATHVGAGFGFILGLLFAAVPWWAKLGPMIWFVLGFIRCVNRAVAELKGKR